MARRKNQKQGVERVFADTVFWIGLTSQRDQHSPRALSWDRWLDERQTSIVTTEAVLWEWLNALSSPKTRRLAIEGYQACHDDEQAEVIPFESEIVEKAIALYQARPDKSWSLTDCLSFVVMEARRLNSALTTDHHFQQAGFQALLLEEPPS